MVQNSCDHQLRFGSLSHHLHGFKNIQHGGSLMLALGFLKHQQYVKKLGGVVSRISRRLHGGYMGLQDSSRNSMKRHHGDPQIPRVPTPPRHPTTSMSRVVPLQQSIAGMRIQRGKTKPKEKKAEHLCDSMEVIWKRLNHWNWVIFFLRYPVLYCLLREDVLWCFWEMDQWLKGNIFIFCFLPHTIHVWS